MTKHDILNHFKNGDVVECLISGNYFIFEEKNLAIVNDCWCIIDDNLRYTLESNGKLARIIQPDKTEVYAQLGKEVEVILKEESNYATIGARVHNLYHTNER